MSPQKRKKFSILINEILCLTTSTRVTNVDDSLIEAYVELVSRIDDSNPIKDSLLLKRPFTVRNVPSQSRSSSHLNESHEENII